MKALLIRALQLFALTLLMLVTIWFTPVDEYIHKQYLNFTVSEKELLSAIDLNEYKLADDGFVILAEAGDQVSGITWNPITDTLFVASQSDVVEILEYDKKGELLRKIPANIRMDIEGIAWAGGNNFALLNERANSIPLAEITPDTQLLDLKGVEEFWLPIEKAGNKGLEGISWNPKTQVFYVVKERNPKALYQVPDFKNDQRAESSELTALDSLMWNKRDFSGMHFDSATDHFLVLSDESSALAEVDMDGKQISTLELLSGWHGLSGSIDQAEGVTMDAEGNIYITSEPDHLYIFEKQDT